MDVVPRDRALTSVLGDWFSVGEAGQETKGGDRLHTDNDDLY